MYQKILRYIIFSACGIGILYYIYVSQSKSYLASCLSRGQQEAQCRLIDKLSYDFSSVNLWLIVIILLIYLLSNYIRALKWDLLLQPLGVNASLRNTLGATIIGYLVNLVLPRAGEVARATALAKNEDISFEKAFGTIVIDRITDSLCLIFIFFLGLIFGFSTFSEYFQQNFNWAAKLTFLNQNKYIAAIFLIIIIGSIYGIKHYLTNNTQSVFVIKLNQILIGLKEGVSSITKLQKPWTFVLFTLTTWLCYFMMTYLMFKAYPATSHLSMTAGLLVFIFGTLGIVFPSPAGVGSYHFMIMEGLALFNVDRADGFVYANLMFFTIQIVANVIFGLLAMLWMKKQATKIDKPSNSYAIND